MELSDESMSDEESSNDSEDHTEVYAKRGYIDSTNEKLERNSNKRKRKRLPASNNSVDETFTHLDLIDLSSISNSSSASIKTSFNRNRSGGNGEMDMRTGFIGEEFVYEYLKKKYSFQTDSISIKWEDENGESHLPHDILLIENGIKRYIEVKATRSMNQHTFLMSMNQMKAILQNGDNYHIYRVYLKQKKLIILNNIESRLKDRNQLALLLTMNPKSLDQEIFTDE